MSKNEVAKKGTTAVSTDVIDMTADAGKGMEGADKESYAIPFLVVLQPLSPQIETIPDAKPGMFLNSITSELYDEVLIIPCGYQRRYLAWEPREAGGAFKGSYDPAKVDAGEVEGVITNDKGQMMIGEDFLKDTRMHYVLVRSASGSYQPAVLSLSSTQVKKSKRFMSLIAGVELKDEAGKPYNPASFSHTYRITTVKEKNEKGSWWGIEVTLAEKITDNMLYSKARAFNEEVAMGKIKTTDPTAETKKGF